MRSLFPGRYARKLMCTTFKCSNAQVPTSSCTNIIMYNITVRDQYSPAIVTVPANILSVEIRRFPGNGTSVVANRVYTITVSAISDQETNYPSDPVVVSKFSFLCVLNVHNYIRMCIHCVLLNIVVKIYA